MKRPIAIVAALGFMACGGADPQLGNSTRQTTAATAAPPKLNASGYLACRSFVPILEEMRDGLLTDSELRKRLREIYETARAEPSAVSVASTDLLRAVTQNDPEQLMVAMKAMVSACERWQERRP